MWSGARTQQIFVFKKQVFKETREEQKDKSDQANNMPKLKRLSSSTAASNTEASTGWAKRFDTISGRAPRSLWLLFFVQHIS